MGSQYVQEGQWSGPTQKLKRGMTRQRWYWGTAGSASETVLHEGVDVEFDAQANWEPVKGVSNNKTDMGELRYVPKREAAV